MPSEYALQIKGLSKDFLIPQGGKVEAVQDVNLDVLDKPDAGEFVCCLGPSGCGKSTVLKMIAGLLEPTSGEVLVAGEKVSKPGRDRGMVFQQYTSFDWLTVIQNIEYGLRLKGVSKKDRRDTAAEYVKQVGLEGFENSYPTSLSGGMKQRVAIARTLANQPRVLLMDEPFGALDAQTRWNMQALLLQLWDNLDNTVVFVTHDVEEAVFLADRICVFSARPGTIVNHVTVPFPRPRGSEIRTSPEFGKMHDEVLQLLRAAPGHGLVKTTV